MIPYSLPTDEELQEFIGSAFGVCMYDEYCTSDIESCVPRLKELLIDVLRKNFAQ